MGMGEGKQNEREREIMREGKRIRVREGMRERKRE
jgi:hypothetical protein